MRIIPLVFSASLTVSTASVLAQGTIDASGTFAGTAGSGNNYNYSLVLNDASSATADIGSFWYGWIPGSFYLPATPSGASAPAGWTASISGNSIQFTANSSANYLTPGSTLNGFNFTIAATPAQMTGTPETTVAYGQGLFSSPSQTFQFTPATAVPEPSSFVMLGMGAIGMFLRGRLFRSS